MLKKQFLLVLILGSLSFSVQAQIDLTVNNPTCENVRMRIQYSQDVGQCQPHTNLPVSAVTIIPAGGTITLTSLPAPIRRIRLVEAGTGGSNSIQFFASPCGQNFNTFNPFNCDGVPYTAEILTGSGPGSLPTYQLNIFP